MYRPYTSDSTNSEAIGEDQIDSHQSMTGCLHSGSKPGSVSSAGPCGGAQSAASGIGGISGFSCSSKNFWKTFFLEGPPAFLGPPRAISAPFVDSKSLTHNRRTATPPFGGRLPELSHGKIYSTEGRSRSPGGGVPHRVSLAYPLLGRPHLG